jgi:hypothetical protein
MAAKSARKLDVVEFVTPWVIARYPHISKPDVGGQKSDGKFKVDGLFQSEEDKARTIAAAEAAAAKLWPGEKDVYLPVKEFFDGKLGAADRKSAGWGITLKSQYRPAVFDAKKKRLPEDAVVGGGSELRVASAFFPWERPVEETLVRPDGTRQKVKTIQRGISLRLADVQVRELRAGSSHGDGAAFDAVEGYEYVPEQGAGEAFNDGATDL